jgi:hypothetical protein
MLSDPGTTKAKKWIFCEGFAFVFGFVFRFGSGFVVFTLREKSQLGAASKSKGR